MRSLGTRHGFGTGSRRKTLLTPKGTVVWPQQDFPADPAARRGWRDWSHCRGHSAAGKHLPSENPVPSTAGLGDEDPPRQKLTEVITTRPASQETLEGIPRAERILISNVEI